MARRTVVVTICDRCEKEVEGEMAKMKIEGLADPRVNSLTADLCTTCVEDIRTTTPHMVERAKRGRRPKAAAAAAS